MATRFVAGTEFLEIIRLDFTETKLPKRSDIMNLAFCFDEPQTPAARSHINAMRPRTESWCDSDTSAPRSPWGPVQHLTDFKNGIIDVITSGHGGMKVTGPLAKKIPPLFRVTWYEEDSDSKIVLFYLYDELRAIADTLTENECGAYGSLRFIKTHTKEQVKELFLSSGHFAATFDFIHKTNRNPETSFSSNWHKQEYAERMLELHMPVVKLSAKDVKTNDVIRFAVPFNFKIKGESKEVTDFQVNKFGRTVELRSVKYSFVARIPRWAQYEFTIVK